jgi:hypothetical protein
MCAVVRDAYIEAFHEVGVGSVSWRIYVIAPAMLALD